MAKNIARWVALGALFLIPLTPLLVSDSFFFPFITGKAFFFRILVEIAVAAWVVLAALDKEYRPRVSWIGIIAVLFVAWMFIADIFAINVTKAFWSNFERMEGWVLLIHLFGLFLAASSVLRAEKKWRGWFFASLIVSLVISCYALLQLAGTLAIHQGSTRIDATLGNSAYLAIYFLFNVCIALWLAFSERLAWLRWSLIALAVLEAVLIFFTETRGTILGLAGALIFVSLLATFTAGGRLRRYAAGALVLMMILIGGFYLARGTSFVKDNGVLSRIASISLADGSVRFTIWRMAFMGVAEHPIIGWGQEGFNYVFDKYYDPSLYQQEPWFDRAHNAFVDWLVAGGIPAFLLYVALFGSALALLWKPVSPELQQGERSEISRAGRIMLTAALVGYAIHNLFVFDNLYSYVYFFMILALIDAWAGRSIGWLERLPEVKTEGAVLYAVSSAAVVAIAVIWMVNVSGMQVASGLITALTPADTFETNLAAFKDLAAHPAFAAQEVREQIVAFAGSVSQGSSVTTAQKQEATSLAIDEMKKQVDAYPQDTRERLQLVYAYRVAGDNTSALREAEIATTLSPKKEQIWVEAGSIEWDIGDLTAAQKDFNIAYSLGPQFQDLAIYAAAGDAVMGDQTTADQILISAFGTTTVDSNVLAAAYYHTKNWLRLIALWKSRVASPDANAQTWFGLAGAYYASGDPASAIQTVRAAALLFPDASSSAAAAINQIEHGQ